MTATNSYYELTQDQTVNNQKTYYTYSNGSYTEVENPKDADIGSYYELKIGYNVDIKRYNGTDWQRLYPRTDWSNIENKPTNFTPSSHNHDGSYVKYGGNQTDIGGSSPASTAKNWANATNLPNGNALVYNSSGDDYTLLYSFKPDNRNRGTILRWGCEESYLRILRYTGTGWQSNDWEKISAGYADTANSVVLTEQTSVWNDNNIKGNVQGSSIGFNANGKVGIRANVTTGNEEDAILFRVNSNTRLQLGDTKFYPTTTNQYSLGSSDKQFKNIYGKTIYEDGTSLAEKYTPNNATLTIQAAGTSKGTFTANASSDVTINITAADLGLDKAMSFIGVGQTTQPSAGKYVVTSVDSTTYYIPITSTGTAEAVDANKGDVFISGTTSKEYVCTTGGNADHNEFEELGDESSFALKTRQITGTGALSGGGTLESDRTITHSAGNAANLAQKLYKISTDAYSHVNAATEVAASDIPDLSGYYLPLSGGDLTGAISIKKSTANLITLKRETNSGGAFIKYLNNNQTTNNWRTGMSSNNNFEFLYNENLVVRVTTTGDIYSGSTKVSLEGHTHSYLPLSGGTMTGAITLTEQSSVWNNNNIKGNGQGSTIGFNTTGKIGFAANIAEGSDTGTAFTFRVNGSDKLRIGDSALRPETTATYDLGTTVKNFGNIYGTTLYEENTSLENKYLKINDVYSWAKASTKPDYDFEEIDNRYDTLLTYSGSAPAKKGSVSPIGMTLSDELSANRLAFISASALTFEYSTNGANWPSLSVSDATKRMLFTQHGVNIPVGRDSNDSEYTIDSSTRITITATSSSGTQYFYCSPKKLLINVSTSAAMQVLIEVRTGTNYKNNGSWARYGVYQLSGWSGWNEIPFVVDTLGGDASQTSNYWQLRLTFTMTTKNENYPKVASVNAIRLYAENCWREPSNLAYNGHMYSYDVSQNVTFPAQVKATDMLPTTTDSYNCGNSSYQWNKIYGKTIYENGTALASKYLQLSGGIMTGGITLPTDSAAFNDNGIIFKTSATNTARIGGDSSNNLGIYAINNLYFRPGGTASAAGTYGMKMTSTDFSPTTNEGISLGTSSYQFTNIYGKTIYENKTALSEKYAAKTHSHDYLPLSRGETSDANTALTTGFYKTSSSVTNTPSWERSPYSQMLVLRREDTYTQILGFYNTGRLFTRSGVIGNNETITPNVSGNNKWHEIMFHKEGIALDYASGSGLTITQEADSIKIEKTVNTQEWDASAFSKEGYKECRVSFKVSTNVDKYFMVGLDSNPASDRSYEYIDYCWYIHGNGKCYYCESGSSTEVETYQANDIFSIEYSHGYVRYYHNGVLKRSVARNSDDLLYFDSSFYNQAYIYDVLFDPLYDTYLSTTKGGNVYGRTEFTVNGTDTPLNIQAGYGYSSAYIEFKAEGPLGYLGVNSQHRPSFYGASAETILTNANFSVSGTTLTITLP